MSLLTKQSTGKVTLSSGVGLKEIKAASVLFVTKRKEINQLASEISIAISLHYANQKLFTVQKNDVTAISEWADTLFLNDDNAFKAFKAFSKKVLGLIVKVVNKDDDRPEDGYEVIVDLDKKRNQQALLDSFDKRIKEAYEDGIVGNPEYYKPKAIKRNPSRSSSSSSSSPDPSAEPGTVTDGVDTVLQEDGALRKTLLNTYGSEEKSSILAEIEEELSEFIEVLLEVTPEQRYRLLQSLKDKVNAIKDNLAGLSKVV